MPIYEYRCLECGAQFARVQRAGAGSEGVTCPKCGSERVERLLSTFAAGAGGSAGASAGPSCTGFT